MSLGDHDKVKGSSKAEQSNGWLRPSQVPQPTSGSWGTWLGETWLARLFSNNARGTADPGYWVLNLNYLCFQHLSHLVHSLSPYLSTTISMTTITSPMAQQPILSPITDTISNIGQNPPEKRKIAWPELLVWVTIWISQFHLQPIVKNCEALGITVW